MAYTGGEEWISTPAHIMLLALSSFDAVDLSITPKQDDPYSIRDGTPSEYLMVPVVPMPDEAMS